MLKKSAAVAVLMLLLSSLTIGSLGQEKASVEVAGAAGAGGLVHRLPDAAGARHHMIMGMPDGAIFTTVHAMSVPGDVMAIPDGAMAILDGAVGISGNMIAIPAGAAGIPAYSVGISGGAVVLSDGATDVSGNVVGEPAAVRGAAFHVSDRDLTTMVIYMNDSWMEVPRPHFSEAGDRVARAVAGDRLTLAYPGFESAVIHGKAAMFWPGREKPELFEVTWKNTHRADAAQDRSFGLFSARMIVPPWAAAGGDAFATEGAFTGIAALKRPMPREIELYSDLTLDLAKVSEQLANVADSQYNNGISMGQSNYHKVDVAEAIDSLNVDVKWKDPDSELRLVIYTPDGRVLGPYDDSSDGKDDGRINMNVSNEAGLAMGEWYLKVAGTDVAGKDEYYVKTY